MGSDAPRKQAEGQDALSALCTRVAEQRMKGVGKPTPFVFLRHETVGLYECNGSGAGRRQESAHGGG